MANTIQTSVNWALGFLGYATPTIGPNNEPAITSANMVQQVMMGPPFRFPWNRNTLNFSTIAGTQDYTQNVTDFGYLETAQLSTGTKTYPLQVKNVTPLGESVDQQVPNTVGVQLNTVGTSVKLRFLGVPDAIYTATIWYQKFPALLPTLASAWVVPDYMSYIYNRGFVAFCLEAMGDPRAQQHKVAFAASLLSTAEGLTESEKNIFLEQYLLNPRSTEIMQLKVQQGIQARGSL